MLISVKIVNYIKLPESGKNKIGLNVHEMLPRDLPSKFEFLL